MAKADFSGMRMGFRRGWIDYFKNRQTYSDSFTKFYLDMICDNKLTYSMKLPIIGIVIFITVSLALSACSEEDQSDSIDTDSSFNYNIVQIGSQCWLSENLNEDKFRNGDIIFHAKTEQEWLDAAATGTPAWCYYKNEPNNGTLYGKLYNWYAVSDPRGLAPIGWRIPTDIEWTILTDFLGGQQDAADKMKSTTGWVNDLNGTNSSGFSALPGGFRGSNGNFGLIGLNGTWWSSTQDTNESNNAWGRFIGGFLGAVTRVSAGNELGYSVRCIKKSGNCD
ncbi:MAG: fibrobacter succinogenes major paralogous domain-containing protein [Cyclobacteriaceae bacterium]